MNLRKIIGLFFLLVGFVGIISKITLTGKVISHNMSDLGNILYFVFIVFGIIILVQNSLDKKIKSDEEEKMEKILKFGPCKKVKLEKIKEEIEKVKKFARNPNDEGGRTYNLHKAPVANTHYLAADAKILNKETNQRGRGNLRYIFDIKTNNYVGMAKENDGGEYRFVA